MGKKVQFAYCKYCKKEVETPKRLPMDVLEKTIWVILTIATLGIAAIALIVYWKYLRPKKYCPECESKLEFSKAPFEKPAEISEKSEEEKTKKEKVLEKVEKVILNAGDLIIISPNIVHMFKAIEDSVMIDMISQSREGSRYEDDVVRVKIGE